MINSVSRSSRAKTVLRPVRLGHSVSLDDAAADPPDDLPDRDELKERIEKQQEKITEIQNRLYGESKQALLVILQGRDTCGKDSTIRRVFGAVNPEGSEVTSFKTPTELEMRHDFLWRIHHRVPPHGVIGIFNRSHYEDVLIVRVREFVPASVWRKRFGLINDFERMLAESRVTILKFFLHISREEQATRLRERLEDPEKNWKFRAGDLAERSRWEDYTTAYLVGTALPDEVIGFPTGLLRAGARGVVGSMWAVPEVSTLLVMARFHELWRGELLGPAEALRRAQRWVRDATNAEKHKRFPAIAELSGSGVPNRARGFWSGARAHGHPYHWAAFTYIGG